MHFMTHFISSLFPDQFRRRRGFVLCCSVARSAFTLSAFVRRALIAGAVLCLSGMALAEPTAPATASLNAYIGTVEARLAQQHQNAGNFLAPADQERLRNGELIIEKLAPASTAAFPGAMLHHWRGTAFAPGAKAADFERLMRNFNAYPQYYAPQVVQAKILSQQGDRYQVVMRVKQRHVITVVMDTAYDVNFARVKSQTAQEALRGYSISRSTRVAEIESAGTSKERALAPGEDHGFLWRLNTYWSYEERDGGLYMQIESVSLTRAIPTGLGWAIGPFIESVPRESLEFTMR